MSCRSIILVLLWSMASVAGCRRTPPADPQIADEIARYLNESPPLATTTCAERDAADPRLASVSSLVFDAQRARPRWDEPLPAELQTRATEADLLGAVSDFACVTRDVRSPPEYVTALGSFAALLVDKGAGMLAHGDAAAGWDHVRGALALFAGLPAYLYLHRFSAFWVLRRTAELLERYPPRDGAIRAALAAALEEAVLARGEFCAGFREEVLAAMISMFSGSARPLRSEVLARYAALPSDPHSFPAVVFGESWGSNESSREAWAAFRALYDPLLAHCVGEDPRALFEDAQPRLAALLALRPGWRPSELTIGRFRDYADLLEVAQVVRTLLAPPAP